MLLRKLRGKVLLLWDGSPIHRGQAVKDFLRAGAAKRLRLEQLPGYAPDLNPDEGIWNYLELSEAGGVGQYLLSRPAGVADAGDPRTRAPAPQAHDHPRVLPPMPLRGVVSNAEFSNLGETWVAKGS